MASSIPVASCERPAAADDGCVSRASIAAGELRVTISSEIRGASCSGVVSLVTCALRLTGSASDGSEIVISWRSGTGEKLVGESIGSWIGVRTSGAKAGDNSGSEDTALSVVEPESRNRNVGSEPVWDDAILVPASSGDVIET